MLNWKFKNWRLLYVEPKESWRKRRRTMNVSSGKDACNEKN
jgi:hypothetical protein